MTRDLRSEIDNLGRQLAALRNSIAGQVGDAAEEASTYLVPIASRLGRQLQHQGMGLARAAQRNPSTATGALVGALVLGGALLWLLSAGQSSEND